MSSSNSESKYKVPEIDTAFLDPIEVKSATPNSNNSFFIKYRIRKIEKVQGDCYSSIIYSLGHDENSEIKVPIYIVEFKRWYSPFWKLCWSRRSSNECQNFYKAFRSKEEAERYIQNNEGERTPPEIYAGLGFINMVITLPLCSAYRAHPSLILYILTQLSMAFFIIFMAIFIMGLISCNSNKSKKEYCD